MTVLLTCLTILLSSAVLEARWPEPEFLVGFWPLDEATRTVDIAKNRTLAHTENARLMTTIPGPFSKPNTAYSVNVDRKRIGDLTPVVLTSSFTVSFYYYSQMKEGSGGILQFIHYLPWIDRPLLGLNSMAPNLLELWGGPDEGVLLGQFPILVPNKWNFITITYTAANNNLVVYYQSGGKFVTFTLETAVPSFSNAWFLFGAVDSGTKQAGMRTTDALACVMHYSTALTREQVEQLPRVCQTKGRN